MKIKRTQVTEMLSGKEDPLSIKLKYFLLWVTYGRTNTTVKKLLTTFKKYYKGKDLYLYRVVAINSKMYKDLKKGKKIDIGGKLKLTSWTKSHTDKTIREFIDGTPAPKKNKIWVTLKKKIKKSNILLDLLEFLKKEKITVKILIKYSNTIDPKGVYSGSLSDFKDVLKLVKSEKEVIVINNTETSKITMDDTYKVYEEIDREGLYQKVILKKL